MTAELVVYAVAIVVWTVLLFWKGDKTLNARMIVCVFCFGAFLLAVADVLSIPNWQLLTDTDKLTLAFYVLLGSCGVVISYWVYKDGQEIEKLKQKM